MRSDFWRAIVALGSVAVWRVEFTCPSVETDAVLLQHRAPSDCGGCAALGEATALGGVDEEADIIERKLEGEAAVRRAAHACGFADEVKGFAGEIGGVEEFLLGEGGGGHAWMIGVTRGPGARSERKVWCRGLRRSQYPQRQWDVLRTSSSLRKYV